MAETVKRGDFIELDYVGRIKSTNQIFDLTIEKIAKEEGVYQEKQEYKPMIICIGAGHLLHGLDREIAGKKVGDEFEIEIPPEEAFGRKNPQLIKLTGMKAFKDQKINPVPGLQFAINGALATVRSVSGGRVMIDFNHPLSGKILKYWVKIKRKITEEKEKVEALAHLLNLKDVKVETTKTSIKIEAPKIKEPVKKALETQIKKFITDKKKAINKIKFELFSFPAHPPSL